MSATAAAKLPNIFDRAMRPSRLLPQVWRVRRAPESPQGEEVLFYKKEPKNSHSLERGDTPMPPDEQRVKVFFLLFLQKKKTFLPVP
ncbi:MAG: hypothetical protein IT555_20045 [Acetobacteraceae bacterium]|nr:hypothetical protein [Acetobacteraceae bacterium]